LRDHINGLYTRCTVTFGSSQSAMVQGSRTWLSAETRSSKVLDEKIVDPQWAVLVVLDVLV
jgi:hypothetical protein